MVVVRHTPAKGLGLGDDRFPTTAPIRLASGIEDGDGTSVCAADVIVRGWVVDPVHSVQSEPVAPPSIAFEAHGERERPVAVAAHRDRHHDVKSPETSARRHPNTAGTKTVTSANSPHREMTTIASLIPLLPRSQPDGVSHGSHDPRRIVDTTIAPSRRVGIISVQVISSDGPPEHARRQRVRDGGTVPATGGR